MLTMYCFSHINVKLTFRNQAVEKVHPITTRGGGHCGRDRMVVGFTTTCAISAYHH